MYISESVYVPADSAKVWRMLSQADKFKLWNLQIVSDEPTAPGVHGVSATGRIKVREGTKVVEYMREVLVWEPGSHLAIELRGGRLGRTPMRVDYRLVSDGENGTTVHYEALWKPDGVALTLLAPLITLASRRHVRRDLRRLSEVTQDV